MLDDRWRHFGTASWTIPTYTKNSTDGISNRSRTTYAMSSVTIEKKVAGEFLDMVVSRYFSFFLREAGTSSRRN